MSILKHFLAVSSSPDHKRTKRVSLLEREERASWKPTVHWTAVGAGDPVDAAEANIGNHHMVVLLLQKRWLIRVLKYRKTWEIRGSNTKKRGKILLGYRKKIYGETQIIDSFSTTLGELAQQSSSNLHHIDDLSLVEYTTPFVWVFATTRIYTRPIPFTRKPGQVVWCRVDDIQNDIRDMKKALRTREDDLKEDEPKKYAQNAHDLDEDEYKTYAQNQKEQIKRMRQKRSE